jgi:hypothetical protein
MTMRKDEAPRKTVNSKHETRSSKQYRITKSLNFTNELDSGLIFEFYFEF